MIVQLPRDASSFRAALYILKGKTMATSSRDPAQLPLKQRPSSTIDLHHTPYGSSPPGSPTWTSKGKRKSRGWDQVDGPMCGKRPLRTNLPFWVLCPSHAGPHAPPASRDSQDPSPAAWGVPAHLLTPTSRGRSVPPAHPIYPPRVIVLLAPWAGPWTRPLWTVTPEDHCVFRPDQEPIHAGPCTEGELTKYLSSWKESRPSLCL